MTVGKTSDERRASLSRWMIYGGMGAGLASSIYGGWGSGEYATVGWMGTLAWCVFVFLHGVDCVVNAIDRHGRGE